MPAALFFLSQEQSECDFSEGSQDAREACGCCWIAACFQLDWRACQSFHLLRNEPPALARSRRRLQYESHAAAFPLTSNPEVLKLILHKGSPSLWRLFEIRLAIMTFLRCLLVNSRWIWKAAGGGHPYTGDTLVKVTPWPDSGAGGGQQGVASRPGHWAALGPCDPK